jgi:hypothetical protein
MMIPKVIWCVMMWTRKIPPLSIVDRVDGTKKSDHTYTIHDEEIRRIITTINGNGTPEEENEDSSSSSDVEPDRVSSVSSRGRRVTRLVLGRR